MILTSEMVKEKKVMIVGLPNTGKSQIFNRLTGEHAIVANYPFTTVEVKRGTCKIQDETYEVLDTPGLHCLYIHSEEELQVRELLLKENPDVIIQCIDANRLKPSLLLTEDLLEMGFPIVVTLNAIDETARRGIWIDSAELSRLLGVPVVESVAVNGLGIKEIKKAVQRTRHVNWDLRYGEDLEIALAKIDSVLPATVSYRRKTALLLLQRDQYMRERLEESFGPDTLFPLWKEIDRIQWRFDRNVSWSIDRVRNRWVDGIAEQVIHKQKISLGGFSEFAGKACRHPLFGIPILFGVLAVIFFSVVDFANILALWMNQVIWVPVEAIVNQYVGIRFWNEFLIGPYGVLTFGFANALLTILPILTVFYLEFALLEDIGYIPNLSVLSKRIFNRLGLSGSAILPLVLGFGCKTMATLTTKMLQSKRERMIAVYLIAFTIPCAPQMATNMSILGRMGLPAFLTAFGVLAAAGIVAGMVLDKFMSGKERSFFMQELPPIRMPLLRPVLLKTYFRIYEYLKEAVPLFLITAVTMFALNQIGVLDAFKQLLQPVVQGLLGLPNQIVDVLISGFSSRGISAALMINLVTDGHLSYIQSIVAVVLTTTFVPCFPNLAAMSKEIGLKNTLVMTVSIVVSSVLLAGGLHVLLIRIMK